MAWELVERLVEADGSSARFGVLDEILARGLRDHSMPPAAVVEACGRLVSRASALDVRALAGDVGWCRRHLTERFRRDVGLPPRQFERVLRFERSWVLELSRAIAGAGASEAAYGMTTSLPPAPSRWRRHASPTCSSGTRSRSS